MIEYRARLSKKALKTLQKIDKPTRLLLFSWIRDNLDGCSNPRIKGKALSGNMSNLWRYRVGDYRIIAEINDKDIVILVVQIGHRRDVYR